ncbi:MAG: cupin domain-containing protein [Xanthobacteraceae bacterium]
MCRIGTLAAAAMLLLLAGLPRVGAQDAGAKVTTTRLFSTTTTASGEPITLPRGKVEVIAWMYEIPVGARLPVHMHPYARYAYVLAGSLRVADAENTRTWDYKAGDFIVEMIGAWHYGTNTGAEPVRLLVIDQVEVGASNTVVR